MMNIKYLVVLSICVCGCYLPAWAQKKNERKDTLRYNAQQITVTATRSPQVNLNVPLAITVVPAEQFKNNRGYGLDEALSLVPGALVQSRNGNQDVRVLIRGFGARGAGQRSNAGTSRGVRFYMDGIPETEPDGRTAFDLIDLAGASSIEVIRSNASALWGNASGGVVNISTIPTEDYAFVNLQNTIGSFGYMKQSLQFNAPVSFGKVYASFNNSNFDGWREHSGSSLFQFNAGMVSQLSASSKLNVFLVGASNFFRIPGPLTLAQFDSAATQAQNGSGYQYLIRDERRFNRLGRLGTSFEHSFGANSSISVTGFLQSKFLQRSERNTFRDFNRYHAGGNLVFRTAFSISDDINNHLTAGADEQYQDGAILFYKLTNGQRGDSLRANKAEGANNFGVFVQDEIRLGSSLRIVLGARYDKISYYNQDYAAGGNRSTSKEDRTFEQITPKAGINYKLSPSMSVYANLGGGVEVPAGNEVDPASTFGDDKSHLVNPRLNDPIRSTTMELGVKHIVDIDPNGFLRDLSYDLALYNVNVTNDLVPYQGGVFYMPAGKSNRSGAELGLNLRFAEGLSLMASTTIASNTYKEYTVDSVFTKSSLDSSLIGKSANYANNKLPGVPDMFSTLRLRYAPTFLPQAFAEVEMRMVGSYFADDANKVSVDAYSVLDAVLGIDQELFSGISLRITARMNNLADTKYMASAWINPDLIPTITGSPAYIEPGMARNVALQVGLRYSY